MPHLLHAPEPHLHQAYGVFLCKKSHKGIRRLLRQYPPSFHGDRNWQVSYVLMDYLLYHCERPQKAVMDLGCGWGPLSLFCAKHIAERVIGVDADSDMEHFLSLQAEINDVEVDFLQKRFEKLSTADFNGVEVIVGSDICFWDNLTDILRKLIKRALKAGVREVILSDPGREPYLTLIEQFGSRYKVVTEPWYALEPKLAKGYITSFSLRK